jgi:acyl-CoA thioesterase
MTTEFTDLVGLAAADDGEWSASIPDGWGFMGIPNGGLVSSVMATALVEATGRPDPITSTAHFLRPAMPGSCVIDTEIIRPGRTLTTARARLRQDDKLVAHLMASLGDLTQTVGDAVIDIRLPPMPPPEECIGPNDAGGFEAPPIAPASTSAFTPTMWASQPGNRRARRSSAAGPRSTSGTRLPSCR